LHRETVKAAARQSTSHVASVVPRRSRGSRIAEVIDFGRVLEQCESHAAIREAIIHGRPFKQRELARIAGAYPLHVAEARRRVLRLHATATQCMDAEALALAFRDELDTVLSLTCSSAGSFAVAV
jgi:hypothetical protein